MKRSRPILVAFLTFAVLAFAVNSAVDPELTRHETLTEYCLLMKPDRLYKKFSLEFECVMKVSIFGNKVNLNDLSLSSTSNKKKLF